MRWLIVLFLFSSLAVARDAGKLPTLSVARIFPAPSGILFPALNSAAGLNPAALTRYGRATAFQAAYSPSLQSGDLSEFFASAASSNKSVGFGAGYLGSSGNGASTHGLFTGAGILLEPVGLGIGVHDLDLSAGGFNPSLDVGILFGGSKTINFGMLLYHLEESAQLGLGVGYSGAKKYNFEVNMLLPPLSTGSKLWIFTVQANVFAGPFAMQFRSSYFTTPSSFTHTIGAAWWLIDEANLALQFSTPRTLTIGLTAAF